MPILVMKKKKHEEWVFRFLWRLFQIHATLNSFLLYYNKNFALLILEAIQPGFAFVFHVI